MNNMYDILTKMNLLEGRGSKPDFLDLDRDGNRTEPMKKAAKEVDEASYSAKAARAGKDIGKPGKTFAKIAKSAGERYGSKERGEKVAGAVLAKLRAKESIDEADMEEGNEFSGELAKARASGAKEFKVDGKSYKVTKEQDEKMMNEDVIEEGFVEFMDRKAAYRSIGADVEGRADDYVVTFKDGTRKRYQDTPRGRRVTTLEPVDAPEATDDEGNVVKRGRGRPKGSKRSLGAKGPTGRSKLLTREQNVAEATGNLASIIRANQRDVDAFMRSGDLSDSLYEVLFDYYMDEMPYGTAKARTGDPYEWISDRFHDDMGGGITEDYDKDEYDEEGEMAKSQARVIADAAQELQDILDDDENLPEWVQKKIAMAKEYIDTARDYLKANRPEEEMMAEKAVSKAQRAAAGIAYAAKKGDIPKSELRGASKEMAKMDTKELKKFAKTKEKGLPEKKKEESVEETTVAGSVATAPAEAKKSKGSIQFGKGIYEGQLEESFTKKLHGVLNEGMSINASVGEDGRKSITVTASDEDAEQLAAILKMAGVGASPRSSTCEVCGGHEGMHEAGCSSKDMVEEELANAPDEMYADTDTMVNKLAGGLNGPKLQVNPNNMGDNPLAMRSLGKGPSGQVNLGKVAENIKTEAENRLWELYQRYDAK